MTWWCDDQVSAVVSARVGDLFELTFMERSLCWHGVSNAVKFRRHLHEASTNDDDKQRYQTVFAKMLGWRH